MKKIIILSALSGLLTAAAFSVNEADFLVFFSYIPFFIALHSCTADKLKYAVITFSLCLYCPLLSFIYPLNVMLPVSGFTAYAAIFIVTLFVSCFQAFFIWLPLRAFLSESKGGHMLFIYPFAMITGDMLQCVNPVFSFPYASAAVCVTDIPAFIQSSSLLGSFFVSYIVLLINSFLAFLLMKKANTAEYAAVAVIVALNTLYGCIRLSAYRQKEYVNAVIVQGNQSCMNKWGTSSEETIDIYSSLLKSAVRNSDIAVFPETVIMEPLTNNERLTEMLAKLSEESGCSIIMGAQYIVSQKRYNAVLCIDENGIRGKPYFKRKLVLFGEKIPFYDYMPESIQESYINFTPGTETVLLDTSAGMTGGIICYESMYPQIARDAVNNGAEFLTVVSNDSWFENTNATNIHFRHSILRSVETGRSVLRCANTGISASISPVGKVTSVLLVMERTAKECSIEVSGKRTLYDITGDIFIYIFSSALILKKVYNKIKGYLSR